MNLLRSLIRRFDDWLSRVQGVASFDDDERVVLRLQSGHLGWDMPLPEGLIRRGTPVLLVHLWNERVPPIPPHGPDLGWGVRAERLALYSFQAIASHLKKTPALQIVQAVGGVTAQVDLDRPGGGRAFLEDLGFTLFPYHRPAGAFGEFWENFYSWWLMWAFNPVSLNGRSWLALKRSEFWMSTEKFLARFGASAPPENRRRWAVDDHEGQH
jgi:hypothetical protein